MKSRIRENIGRTSPSEKSKSKNQCDKEKQAGVVQGCVKVGYNFARPCLEITSSVALLLVFHTKTIHPIFPISFIMAVDRMTTLTSRPHGSELALIPPEKHFTDIRSRRRVHFVI
jgi:hypothetical protein